MTTIDTASGLASAWAAVTDVTSWPQWTASMHSVELLDGQPLHLGSRARIKQPKLPVTVWEVSELNDTEFTWVAKSPGVTTAGRHALAVNPDGTTRITLEIDQRGPLAPVIGAFIGGRTRRYMAMEAAGLKAASESHGE